MSIYRYWKYILLLVGTVIPVLLVSNVFMVKKCWTAKRAFIRKYLRLHDIYISDPSKSVICHTFTHGRLGNHLFEYASILGIASTTNKTFYFKNDLYLKDVLKFPWILRHENEHAMFIRCKKARNIGEQRMCKFQRRLIDLKPATDYNIIGYLQSWLYFDGIRDALPKAMTFKDEIVEEARKRIEALRREHNDSVLVGIHVRRGDKAFLNFSYKAPPASYFAKAQAYMRQRISGRVLFVVSSEPIDTPWCRQHIGAVDNDVVVLTPRSPAVDLQTLSMTDHLILSGGTFGWWAAFKMTGKPVVVFRKQFATSRFLRENFSPNATDHMLPRWIAVDD